LDLFWDGSSCGENNISPMKGALGCYKSPIFWHCIAHSSSCRGIIALATTGTQNIYTLHAAQL